MFSENSIKTNKKRRIASNPRSQSEPRSEKRDKKQKTADEKITEQKGTLADQNTGTFRNSLFVSSGKLSTKFRRVPDY